VVLSARDPASPAAAAALETLCRAYWYPLYLYVRRHGYSPSDAQDLTQDFFARLLKHNDLARVSPEKGKFRSFLLASLKHFLANEYKRAHRLKRGGWQTPIALDAEQAEGRYGREPFHDLTPEKVFERRWALTVLERSLARLQEEQRRLDRLLLFDRLKDCLVDDGPRGAYAKIAKSLGLTEDAVKMAAHRFRKRYREVLREEIACTVATPADVDDELQRLLAVLS
jgi:RNA polymerase sigma-70 factor (ECF subfamily)